MADVRVEPQPASLVATTATIDLRVSTPLWLYWLDIALEHVRLAIEARVDGRRLQREGQPFGDAMGAETRASMVASTASAAAVESFCKTVSAFADRPDLLDNKQGKHLPAAMAADNVIIGIFTAEQDKMSERIEILFKRRNEAIHSPEADEPPEPHPLGGSVGHVHATFTAECAVDAVSLAAELLADCISSVRPDSAFDTVRQRLSAHRQRIEERRRDVREIAGKLTDL